MSDPNSRQPLRDDESARRRAKRAGESRSLGTTPAGSKIETRRNQSLDSDSAPPSGESQTFSSFSRSVFGLSEAEFCAQFDHPFLIRTTQLAEESDGAFTTQVERGSQILETSDDRDGAVFLVKKLIFGLTVRGSHALMHHAFGVITNRRG